MSRFNKALILVIGLISTLILAGCNSNVQTNTPAITKSPIIKSPSINSPSTSVSSPSSLKTNTPLTFAYVTLSVPNLPKPGELADFIINVKFSPGEQKYFPQGAKNGRVWTEFYYSNPKESYSEAKRAILIPPSKVVVEGLTSWEGDLAYNIQSNSKIRLPLEGVWCIKIYFSAEGYAPTWDRLYFASLDGYAVGLTYGGQYNTPSYLRNFEYGTYPEFTVTEGLNPIGIEADISKPPKVGEEAVITCRMKSVYDVPGFSAQFEFFKRRLEVDGVNSVPPDMIMVAGKINWEGDLKANQITEFSATIRFPEAGEWRVLARGNIQINRLADSINLNITDNVSSYGWEKREPKSPNK
jgi:hypothetical protein